MTKIKCIALWLLFVVNSSFQCKIPIQCDCYLDKQGNFDYECPEIHIAANHNSTLDITCRNSSDFNIEEILDKIDIELFHKFNPEELQLIRCRLFTSFPNISNSESDGLDSIVYYYGNNFRNFYLAANDFHGLEGVKHLVVLNSNADDEEIEQDVRLTPDTFKYLSELRYLKFIIKLETLPIGVFDNLHYLETLLLPSNNLVNLHADILKNLHNLQSLDLSNNYIEEIPEAIFKKNINLKTVNLNYNLLTTLPKNLFENLPKLVQISIMKCKLDDLSENLFHGSNSLEEINLSWNFLKSLPENIFKDLNLLKHLDLSNNRIGQIPAMTFNPLRSLRILNLSDNALVRLNKNQFGNLKLVEIIDMSNNNLTTIHVALFWNTMNLKELYLQNNCLRIPRRKMEYYIFHNTPNLEIINLSNNNLTVLKVYYISNKSKLRKLDLRYNQIESISIHQFQSDSNKIEIDLRNNKISSVDFDDMEEVSRNRSIAYKDQNIIIKLDENPIQCDCFSYKFLKYLDQAMDFPVRKFIEIQADNLKCNSSNALAKNLNLETVTCSLEDFSVPKCSDVCKCYYRPWDNSIIVDCENKKLTRVPDIILPHNISKIISNLVDVEVNLKNNLLISAPNVTVGYENITKLFLSSNNISELNWIPPNIKVLELNNNNLSSFDEDLLAKLNSIMIDTITLGNNPWNCDCSSLHLYKYLLSNNNSKHIDVRNITCAHHGKAMILLTPEDLCSTINIYIGSVACAVIILVICVLVIVYHYQEDKIKIWLYAHNMCMWFVKEEDLDKDKIYDAFISYSHMDEEFILNELQPSLESGPNPYKLCLHVRDWVPGKGIAKQINNSIKESRRTVVILSSHFLDSVWGILEFRTAHIQATQEGRARIIVVIYGDLNLQNLDDELKGYVETNTYIKWGDPWFWKKLKYALPHRK